MVVLTKHIRGTTRIYNILYENIIIIIPPPHIYYTFIVVMGQKIGWLATYLEIVVVLLEHTRGTTITYWRYYQNILGVLPSTTIFYLKIP